MSRVLLGLPGFVVLAAGEVAGEVELLVKTTAPMTGCPRCGVVAVPPGRRPLSVPDLPAAGRPVVLVWSKRLWHCPTEPRAQPAAHLVEDQRTDPTAVAPDRAGDSLGLGRGRSGRGKSRRSPASAASAGTP